MSTLLASALPLAVLAAFCWLSLSSKPSHLTLCLASIALGLPVLLALVSLFVGSLPLARYSIIVIPALYGLIASGVASLPRPYSLLTGGVLIIAMLCALIRQTFDPNLPARQDYSRVGRHLATHVGSNDVVLVSSPFVVFPIEYYFGRKVNTIPIWDRGDFRFIPPFDELALRNQVADLMRGKDKCWLVLGCDQGSEQAIENFFNGSLRRTEFREFSPGLRLGAFREGRPIRTETRAESKAALNPLYGARLYVHPDSPDKALTPFVLSGTITVLGAFVGFNILACWAFRPGEKGVDGCARVRS